MSTELYPSPFSPGYWCAAAGELKKPRILAVAALMIALRVALKSLAIPVGPYLNITVGFFINALGAMIFGPVVAIFAAAVSDTLGCLLFPSGAYFFPFIFVEIAGSLIFALFLYRAKTSVWRVILSRFSVVLICNFLLNPAFLVWYNKLLYGKEYAFFSLPRMVKNLCLFPAEAFLLVLFLNLMVPVTNRMGLTYAKGEKMKFVWQHIVALVIMALIAAGSIIFYGLYKGMK